jgi:hypothetical protein
MPDKTHADIPLSFFEYRAIYQEPIFNAQKLYWGVSEAVFRAFRGWNITLENVSHKQNPLNFGEIATTFVLFGGRFVFTVGLGPTTLLAKDLNWSETELIMNIGKSGMAAVLTSGGMIIEQQRASIAMHLRPSSGSIKDITLRLARPIGSELLDSEVRSYGLSVYRQDSSWVVDASAAYANALFVRIDHILGPKVPFEEIASRLKIDEIKLLNLLKLEVD